MRKVYLCSQTNHYRLIQVETKRATPREARENPEACQSVTKVFVGGLPEEVEDEEIQAYFEQVKLV